MDNGSEFSDCYGMEHDKRGNQRTTVYYCHPFSSYERGSNENDNRIIRRFFPKHSSFKNVKQKDVQYVQYRISAMPHRILGYASAQELFDAEIAALGLRLFFSEIYRFPTDIFGAFPEDFHT